MTNNWKTLSKQLLAFNGHVELDRNFTFIVNNIEFTYIYVYDEYGSSHNLAIRDPETKEMIDISDFIPSRKRICNHIHKLYNAQRDKRYDEKKLAQKTRAEQILFGTKNEPQTPYNLQES
jgi:hypothetical protein